LQYFFTGDMKFAHKFLHRYGALKFELSHEIQIDGVDYH
jgi:hypothetical protein